MGHGNLNGDMGMVKELTRNVTVQRAASVASGWRRISSATPRRPELGEMTVCSP
jgi:hypothetical protein